MPEPELTDGVYQWNVSEEKIKNFATIQEVIDVVRDFKVDDKAIGVNFFWNGVVNQLSVLMGVANPVM